MELSKESGIIQLVEQDAWMMQILRTAGTLGLPDWWVCAGFVRSKVWDALHGYAARTPLPDVDVIYFDERCLDEEVEKRWEKELRAIMPGVPWSVKNEARMHLVNGISPYSSSVDAMSKFPETVTALGLSLDEQGRVILSAPCGVEDLVQMVVRPSPYFLQTEARKEIYEERVAKKNWKRSWPRIRVEPIQSGSESECGEK